MAPEPVSPLLVNKKLCTRLTGFDLLQGILNNPLDKGPQVLVRTSSSRGHRGICPLAPGTYNPRRHFQPNSWSELREGGSSLYCGALIQKVSHSDP